jgi:hypothetical protein
MYKPHSPVTVKEASTSIPLSIQQALYRSTLPFWLRITEILSIYDTSVWPPLWSSGQRSWLQIQRSGLDSRHYQLVWEVVGLERGPLSLVSTTEELLGRNINGAGLGSRDSLRWPCDTLYPQKLTLTSPTRGGLSVGIVRSRTQATEFICFLCYTWF